MKLSPGPELPLPYFSLQLAYAERAARISNIPLEQALMKFTSFWRRIHDPRVLKINKMEWSFDPGTLPWRELCERINNNKERADTVAYDLYLRNNNNNEAGKQYFGCFRYDFVNQLDDECGVIKIHFKNRDNSGEGPLAKARQEARLDDLRSMFKHIRENHPEAKVVKGGSWLYNLRSYQRLFPKTFTSDMKVEEIPFPRSSGIWGQFINSEGQVNEKMKSSFIQKMNAAKNPEELLGCFEFKILFARTEIENFYNHLVTID